MNAREPHFVWFGRERDTPPPTRTIYVDWANNTGIEDGTQAHPYNTVAEGHTAASLGDTLSIRAGNYPGAVRLNKSVTVRSTGGTAAIGRP